MIILIALIGNPNSGKTTIFNKLTKSNKVVGNFSGVTVNESTGNYKGYNIIDLPGIYSLIPYTKEEVVTIDYINNNDISLIINVIDANILNRSLYLTSRLMELSKPMIIILTKYKGNIDIKLLEELLGMKIIIYNKDIYKNIDSIIDSNNTNYNRFKKIDDIYLDINYRYKMIDEITNKVISNNTDKDIIIHNKYLSMITNILLFILVYFVSINIIGSKCIDIVSNIINIGINYVSNYLNSLDISYIFKDLIINGIFKGISNIVSFIPLIIILTFIISLLEDSGYITRMSLIFDRLLRIINLSGKSFQPLLSGATCSVLGIMSTRTIKDKKDRLKTIFLIPFIPCSAKLTIMIYITTVFFHNSFYIFLSFYIVSIMAIIISSRLFSKNNHSYIIEVPSMKIPSISIALKNTYNKVKGYLFRIITVILFISIINFILIKFDTSFNYGVSYNNSILYMIGSKISNIFKLFRIKESISILSGIIAKEEVVSTLSVLGNNLDKLSAYLFCIFNIITIPCINTIISIKSECGYKVMFIYTIFYLVISYIVTILIYIIFRIII